MGLSWQSSCSCLDAFPVEWRRSKTYQQRADMCWRVIGPGCAGCDELDALFAQCSIDTGASKLCDWVRAADSLQQAAKSEAGERHRQKGRHWVGWSRRWCDSASARRGPGEWPGWLTASNRWQQMGVKPRCPTAIWPALGGRCALECMDVGFPSFGFSGESLVQIAKGDHGNLERIGQPHRVDVYASASTACHSLPKN
jgi:hypothetical protein